ncbi:MAG: hemerythrin domain-containing protein [Acidimicrobiales bacterium]
MLDLALRGMSYEEIGLAFRLSPGLAYLIATGVPPDGSDSLSPEERRRPGLVRGSTQHLSNPPRSAPTVSDTVHRWMVEMASADTQMGSAARARGAEATPAPPQRRRRRRGRDKQEDDAPVPESPDVLSVLRHEHNQIRSVLQQLSSAPGMRAGSSPEELSRKESLADVVVQRLSAHETAEERLFWPAVADTIDGGPAIAAIARAQEKEGKHVLGDLRRIGVDNEGFGALVEQLADLVRKHVAFEDAVFARVEAQLPEDGRRQLGGRLEDLLGRSPTRSHPHAPSGAGALHVAGSAAASADKKRDDSGTRTAGQPGRASNVTRRER